MLLMVAAGDRQAFDQLHAALRPVVRDYLQAMAPLPHHQEREHMVQEVFFRAWRNAPRLRAAASAKTYLFPIAKRVLGTELLHRARLPIIHLADMDHLAGAYVPDGPADRAGPDHAQLSETVEQAKTKLSDLRREALELVCGQSLSAAAAATMAGCSQNVLAKRLHDARKQLSRELKGHPPEVTARKADLPPIGPENARILKEQKQRTKRSPPEML